MKKSMRLIASTALVSTMMFAGDAKAGMAEDIQELKQQLNSMASKIEVLEKSQNGLKSANRKLESENRKLKSDIAQVNKNVAGQAVADYRKSASSKDGAVAAAKSSDGIMIPGTNTSLKLGGYVKVDAIADIGQAYGGDFAKFAAIPLDGSRNAADDGEFTMHARQTRLNLSTNTPTDLGDLKFFTEVDFYGTRGSELVTNGHSPQLRQAYGKLGPFLAGQTWSNFMDLAAYPESLDFVGPVGITLLRQTQIRYSNDIDEKTQYSLSIENPNTDFTNGGTDVVTEANKTPDFIAAVTHKDDWGHVSLRGLLRRLGVDNETDGSKDSATAYGLTATAKLKIGEKDNLKLRATVGEGLGRYIYDIATSSKSAAYGANDQFKAQEAWAGYMSYQHFWNDNLRSNFMGGYASIDNATNLIGSANNESIWSAHANLIWQPHKSYKVGIEYIHGERELDSGLSGDLDRVVASFIYNMN